MDEQSCGFEFAFGFKDGAGVPASASEQYVHNKQNVKIGDRVRLLDYSHETCGHVRLGGYWHWVSFMDPHIGKWFRVKKLIERKGRFVGARLEGFSDSFGFNFYWLEKEGFLSDDLFEI